MTHQTKKQVSLNLQDFNTRFLHTLHPYEELKETLPGHFIDLPMENYNSLGLLIHSLTCMCTRYLYLESKKEKANPEVLADISHILMLITKLIPFSELRGLDYILDLLEIKTLESLAEKETSENIETITKHLNNMKET